MDAFEQLILREWIVAWDNPRIYYFSIPHGCTHMVLCFTFISGGVGVISEGIFENEPPAMTTEDAVKIRHFVGCCKEETEDTLRSMLLSSTYKPPPSGLERFSVHCIHEKHNP